MARLTGVLAGLALVLGVGGCSALPGGGTADKEITIYLNESAGLFVGNDVGVLGVPVGVISEITPQGNRVQVKLTVDGDVDIPADAGAAVTSRSVATDRYVELTPVYKGGPKMKDGATIPPERTVTPIDFDEVLATLSGFAKDITGSEETTDAIKRFLKVGATAFEGNGQHLNSAIRSVGAAVNAISGQRENIIGTLTALDVLTQALAANDQTIRSFTRSVSSATQLLATERNNLDAALTSLAESITVVSKFANTHRSELIRTVDNLSETIGIILKERKNLGEFVETFPLVAQNVQRAMTGNKLNARLSPQYLLPVLGQDLQLLCQAKPLDLCKALGDVAAVIGGLAP